MVRRFEYGIGYGIRRAVLGFISGLVTDLLIEMVEKGLAVLGVPSNLIVSIRMLIGLLVITMSLIDFLTEIERMRYWGTAYLFGFVIGLILKSAIGLLDLFDVVLIWYGAMVLVIRVSRYSW